MAFKGHILPTKVTATFTHVAVKTPAQITRWLAQTRGRMQHALKTTLLRSTHFVFAAYLTQLANQALSCT